MKKIDFLDDDDRARFEQMKADWKKMVDYQTRDIFLNGVPSASTILNRYRGISPTDKDARGLYSYQEPERDEQGTYYGYKVVKKHCEDPRCDEFVSPRYSALWQNGRLVADREPSEDTMFGIHCTKRPNHPELRNYLVSDSWESSYRNGPRFERSLLVKCALFGTVIETEQGFRAEKAQIIGVLEDGHWKTYQDYQERSRTYPRSDAPSWEEEGWRFRYGANWGASYSSYDPTADS